MIPLNIVPTDLTEDTEAYGLIFLESTERIDAARHTTECTLSKGTPSKYLQVKLYVHYTNIRMSHSPINDNLHCYHSKFRMSQIYSISSYYEKILATGKVKCIDEEVPFEIPQGWEWCRIRNISQSYIGLTYSPSEVSSQGTIVLRSSNIQDGRIVFDDIVRVTKNISEKLLVEKNDIIICARNGSAKLVGKSAIVTEITEPMTFGAFMAICKTSLYQYVSIFLQSNLFFSQLRGVSGTTTINQLTQNNFNGFLIAIPPLEEQHRIFEKINDVLPIVEIYGNKQEQLNKLNDNLRENVKKSILQEAIQGRLVQQIAEESTAQELLKQIKAEKQKLVKEGKLKKSALNDSVIFRGDDNKYWEKKGMSVACIDDEIPFEIPSTWIWCRLGGCVKIIGGYAFKSYELKSLVGYRVIRISDISENGLVNKNIVRYGGNEDLDQYFIKGNDILIAMTGGTVGKSLLLNNALSEPLLLNQRVAIIRNFWINVEYLNAFLHSPYIKQIIDKKKKSTNDNISMSDLNDFLLPLPPLKEQHRIVEKFKNVTSTMSR